MAILFHVYCTTCRARLQVRNAAAIGKILTCPKCQGMVKVESPEGWRDPEADQDTVDDIELEGRPVDSGASLNEPDSPMVPGEAWVSDKTRAMKRRSLMVVVGAVFVLLLGLLVWRIGQQFSPSQSGSRETAISDPKTPGSNSKKQKRAGGDNAAKVLEQQLDSPEPDTVLPEEVPIRDGKQVSVPVPPAPAEREDPDLPTERPNLRDVHVPESGPNEDTEKGTDTEPVPPGLVPKPEPKKTDPGAVNALEKLEAMINPDEPQEGEQPSVGFSANRTLTRPVRKRDVASLFQTNLTELTLSELPVSALPQVVLGLTGVPVSLDLDSMTAAEFSWSESLSGQWKSQTMAAVIESITSQLSLTVVTTDIGIRLVAETPEEFVVRYSLDEMPGGDDGGTKAMEVLATSVIVGDSIPNLKESIRINGSVLEVKSSKEVHAAIRQFQASYLWHRWQQLGTTERLSAPLDQKTSVVFFQPLPLAGVLQELSDATGVAILVDWDSAALVGCDPQTQVTLVAHQEPLAILLHRLLADSLLSFRRVDERTIAVHGTDVETQTAAVRFHAIADHWGDQTTYGPQMEKIMGELLRNSPNSNWYCDTRARCLVVSGTARNHAEVARALQAKPVLPKRSDQNGG